MNCPRCGGELIAGDRFCGECGYDTQTQAASSSKVVPETRVEEPLPKTSPSVTQPLPSNPPGRQPEAPFAPALGYRDQGAVPPRPGGAAPIIIVVVAILVLLAGGGLYWWLSQRGVNQPGASPSGNQPAPTTQTPTGQPGSQPAPQRDLTRAATYLPEFGLKCSFFMNYPDGNSGPMERVSAQVVPVEAVRISEVEMIQDSGQTVGYGFHYIERVDGTYLVYDMTPQECSPVLKNNLTIGQSWNYGSEFGQIVWTVVDMGVRLDLGFTTLDNCLLVEEDNQAVGFKKIIYYAPGMGRVLERTSAGGADLLKLTAFSRMDAGSAVETVKRWSPNYQSIRDDRTQK